MGEKKKLPVAQDYCPVCKVERLIRAVYWPEKVKVPSGRWKGSWSWEYVHAPKEEYRDCGIVTIWDSCYDNAEYE